MLIKNAPKISVILPVYNGADVVSDAIKSILEQSFTDFELIIINDESRDATPEILEKFKEQDGRIIIINHEKNTGLTESLNEGLEHANGKYLARLDCDDVWINKNKLQKQFEFLETNEDYGLIGSWAEFTDGSGKHLKYFKPPLADKSIRKQMLWRNCFIHSSILAKKTIVEQLGGYLAEDRYVEDYGLWLRMGLITKLANLPELMVKYRVVEAGITQTKNLEQISRILGLIRKFKGNYPGYSLARFKWNLQMRMKTWHEKKL